MTRKCATPGCLTKASFNYVDAPEGPLFCGKCKSENMENLVGRTCRGFNCLKRPSYNYITETKALYCKGCALEGMRVVRGKKCLGEGCRLRPFFNYPLEKSGIYCKSCKLEGMISLKVPKCRGSKCHRQGVYNLPGELKPLWCDLHKHSGMVDILYSQRKEKERFHTKYNVSNNRSINKTTTPSQKRNFTDINKHLQEGLSQHNSHNNNIENPSYDERVHSFLESMHSEKNTDTPSSSSSVDRLSSSSIVPCKKPVFKESWVNKTNVVRNEQNHIQNYSTDYVDDAYIEDDCDGDDARMDDNYNNPLIESETSLLTRVKQLEKLNNQLEKENKNLRQDVLTLKMENAYLRNKDSGTTGKM